MGKAEIGEAEIDECGCRSRDGTSDQSTAIASRHFLISARKTDLIIHQYYYNESQIIAEITLEFENLISTKKM